MYVSNECEQPGAKNVVAQVDTTEVAPEVLSTTSRSRSSPSTVEKLPMAMTRLPSGVASIFVTARTPPLCGPAKVCCMNEVSLPVVGSSDASWPRATPPTVVN